MARWTLKHALLECSRPMLRWEWEYLGSMDGFPEFDIDTGPRQEWGWSFFFFFPMQLQLEIKIRPLCSFVVEGRFSHRQTPEKLD